ncbi:MAG: toll/interleukin-1 receptor domain-containing protein [Actinobacteria bacterium]|nr:toll/interleukin-1 receptor domain-containing protein [Actinomycetota bacterium]
MTQVVFISHSSMDAETARELADALRSRGMDPWLASERVTPGGYYASEITRAIAQADAVVVLLSRASITSPQVKREVDSAVSADRPLIPLDLHGIRTLSELPDEWQYLLRLTQWHRHTHASDTAHHLERILLGEASSGPTVRASAPRAEPATVTIADSNLLVVKAFLLASRLANELGALGAAPHMVNAPWSSNLLDRAVDGELDFLIYNEVAARSFAERHPDELVVVAHAGHSMGGNNFGVLVSNDSRWRDVDLGTLGTLLDHGVRIYLGLNSDRARNFSLATGLTLLELRERGVVVVNAGEPGLEILASDPDAIIVTGQNARFEARLSGAAYEVGGFERLPPQTRKSLRQGSSNVLLARLETANQLGLDLPSLGARVKRNAAECWADDSEFESLVSTLAGCCDFQFARRQDRILITKHVLYETYRAGEPVL